MLEVHLVLWPASPPREQASEWLDAPELLRWSRFTRSEPRDLFLRSRIALKNLLGTVLGCRPQDVSIAAREGKPRLETPSLEFSLSHTRGATAVAISSNPVGVDVESAARVLRDPEGLGWLVLSETERAWVADAPDEARLLSLLVQKEAQWKLNATDPGPTRLQKFPFHAPGLQSWRTSEPDFLVCVAALALPVVPLRVHHP